MQFNLMLDLATKAVIKLSIRQECRLPTFLTSTSMIDILSESIIELYVCDVFRRLAYTHLCNELVKLRVWVLTILRLQYILTLHYVGYSIRINFWEKKHGVNFPRNFPVYIRNNGFHIQSRGISPVSV